VRAREERKAEGRAPKASGRAARGNGTAVKPEPALPSRLSKNGARRVAGLEQEIAAAEGALSALEDELADPGAWSDSERSARSSKRHVEAKQAVEQLYARLEAVGG